MSEPPSCVASLLATPTSESLGGAREEMLTSTSAFSTISAQEFVKQMRYAVSIGDSEAVHRLLRTPKLPPVELKADSQLICLAASRGYVDIVGLLLRHGADVNARSSEDSTPLICAADSGYLNVLALLLNAGARMDLLNHNGETALARATRKGWAHCARLLLTYGANPQPMATDGHPLVVSPLHLARQMHQTAIEKDILTRSVAMENRMLEIVKATIPKHISLLEPGHLVDTKTSSFFPIQLISEEQLSRFVLYFKTPPGYEMVDVNNSLGVKGSSSSDELILVYVVRVQLLDGHIRHWLTGPGFDTVRLSFNGTRRHCTRMPGCTEYPGLCVYSVASAIKSGGLNTLCLDSPSSAWKHGSLDTQSSSSPCSTPSMVLIGAYRVRIDVTSLIQASAGLTFGGPNKPTIYIPRSVS
ncbi:hypothetical protein CRM22_003149 [Opisthorchis felineus]|uniref:Uncharacterized protein n=3 Tax=Opisthorchis felineus TaxID=147828 RepID=A0A4S2M8U6_OPIFE|nr:hypothetical protein CRM22_003149 [Opisthorchis felineus]TGZ70518.1 hypothetical protein CRM22_003149 [Opisthorchis felineus]